MSTAHLRALVTGGAGFIGSHLVDALLASGHTVTVLDDLSTGKKEWLDGHDGDPRYRGVRGSVTDAALLDELAGPQDVIYHLAAAVGVGNIVADPLGSMLTNIRGTELVLAAAFAAHRPVVLASTSEIYGKSIAFPFREDGERVLGPTWIHRWSYSTSKAIDEHLAFAYVDRGLPVGILRYFNAYGPRIDERGYGSVIARFASQALAGTPLTVHGDGGQSRCFTYVADTVRGTMAAAAAAVAGRSGVYNIGTSQEITIEALARLVIQMLGSSSLIERVPYESVYGPGFEDTRRRVPDTTRAERDLGFRATVTLRDGLTTTLDWCRAHYSSR
jgi:UDP-glucose 4-epimerase